MLKFSILALTVAAFAAPALAAPQPSTTTFTHNGRAYVATVHRDGAAQLIDGEEVETGRRFHLRVANGRVSGDYAGTTVAYPVPTRALTQTASN